MIKRLVVGISGASGAIYGIRLLEVLAENTDVETHLVVSPSGARTITLETDYTTEQVNGLASHVHRFHDIAAAISSGSFKTAGMVIVPCSMKTLSGIAHSYTDNLLTRAADVTLKEQRKLILVARETPLHLGHLRAMTAIAEMGGVVMPPMPAFYHRPKSLSEIIDQTVNRVLDSLGIDLPEDLFARWQGAGQH